MPWKFLNIVDGIISRFRVEHVEGELAVAGRPVSTHCPVLILVFSGCFFMAGLMLTILSYRPGTSSFNSYLRHLSGSHIAGPALLIIGLILLAIGMALQMIVHRLKQMNRTEEGGSSSSSGGGGMEKPSLSSFRTWIRWAGNRIALVKRRSLKGFIGIPVHRVSKRRQVIQDLLHTSATNDSIASHSYLTDGVRQVEIASFPTSSPPKNTTDGDCPCLS